MAVHQDASTGEITGTPDQPEVPATTAAPTMHVKVYSPFRIYYDKPAESVSAVNETGPFDILPKHHNFMTLLTACDIVIRSGELQHKIRISRGVMHVKSDQVIVFLDV